MAQAATEASDNRPEEGQENNDNISAANISQAVSDARTAPVNNLP